MILASSSPALAVIVMGELVIDLNRGAIDTRLIQWLSSGGTLSDEELEGTEARDDETMRHCLFRGCCVANPPRALSHKLRNT